MVFPLSFGSISNSLFFLLLSLTIPATGSSKVTIELRWQYSNQSLVIYVDRKIFHLPSYRQRLLNEFFQ